MSTFDFIDTSNLFDNSGDWSDGYDIMLDLEDITNSSDDEKNLSFSLFQAATPPVVLLLGCRVLVWLTSRGNSFISVCQGVLS